jgi:Fe-S-cluster formation regulator IscX/YfhJ
MSRELVEKMVGEYLKVDPTRLRFTSLRDELVPSGQRISSNAILEVIKTVGTRPLVWYEVV